MEIIPLLVLANPLTIDLPLCIHLLNPAKEKRNVDKAGVDICTVPAAYLHPQPPTAATREEFYPPYVTCPFRGLK
jgi:hypothetical protein